MDFLKYTVEEARKKAQEQKTEMQLHELVSRMASTKTTDYLFRNRGDLTFENYTKQWGIDVPNLSFGAAYADLDNDGDLELVTNNTNETATVWLNQDRETAGHNFLRVRLKGSANNPFGIGAKVYVTTNGVTQLQEQFLTRGYQSSVDPILHFGLGMSNRIEMTKVIWPDGRESIIDSANSNQLLEIAHSSAVNKSISVQPSGKKIFVDVSDDSKIDFVHRENKFPFDRTRSSGMRLSRSLRYSLKPPVTSRSGIPKIVRA
jgi:hypothetical protein